MPATPAQNPGIPPRVAPQVVPFVIKEEFNRMVPTIPISTHDMANKIEDEPLPWYLVNTFVDPDMGAVLQYKYLIHSKD